MTSIEAPTTPRCCLTVRRVRFLATSCGTTSQISKGNRKRKRENDGSADFGDALLVLPPVERGPSYPPRVLALKEEGLRLAILKSKDFAIAADEELTL